MTTAFRIEWLLLVFFFTTTKISRFNARAV